MSDLFPIYRVLDNFRFVDIFMSKLFSQFLLGPTVKSVNAEALEQNF